MSTKTIGELFIEFLHSNQPLAVAIRKAVSEGKMPLTAQKINKATPLEDWRDAQDVMQALHISPRTLATLRANGTLPYSKLGGRCRYRKSDIEKVLDDHDTMLRLNPSLTFAYPFFLLSSTLWFSFAVLCTTNFSQS